MKRSAHAQKWHKTEKGKLYKFYLKLGTYGISEEQFRELLEIQDNRCAICQITFSEQIPPRIDHDHTCCPRKPTNDRSVSMCGRCVRGLLCNSCNVGIGMLGDNVERLISAVNYLQSHKSINFAKEESLELLELIYNVR